MTATTNFTIRLAVDSDAQGIANLSRCLIEVGLRGWSWDPQRVARAIHHRDMCVVVAETAQQFAGFAIGEFGDTRLHLSLLAVDASRQRSGIGRALMQWLEDSALIAGITEVQLELRANNSSAHYFYQALGFALERAVPRYYRGEESALKMCKILGNEIAQTVRK